MKNIKQKIKIFIKGFAMGTVDIIPGISGGTMALILGIYQKIIDELKMISFKNIKKINYGFLIPLFLGIIIAIISLARIIHYLLENHSIYLYSFFFGLIIASIFIILPKNFYKNKKFLFVILGFLIAWFISGSASINTANNYLNIFLSGAIAICAMILPGISGSFILLILGKYEFMISVLKNPFVNNNLIYIIVFVAGCIIGLLSFVRLLSYTFKKYYNISLAILIGFMAGALRKVWPFENVIRNKNFDIYFYLSILMLIIGILTGILITKIGKQKKNRN